VNESLVYAHSMMNVSFKRALAIAALISIGLSNGLHVAPLQAFAWFRMYSEYSEIMPAFEAVSVTFSGKELCVICLAADNIRADMEGVLGDFVLSSSSMLFAMLAIGLSPKKPDVVRRNGFRNACRPLMGYCSLLDAPPPRAFAA